MIPCVAQKSWLYCYSESCKCRLVCIDLVEAFYFNRILFWHLRGRRWQGQTPQEGVCTHSAGMICEPRDCILKSDHLFSHLGIYWDGSFILDSLHQDLWFFSFMALLFLLRCPSKDWKTEIELLCMLGLFFFFSFAEISFLWSCRRPCISASSLHFE